MSLCSACRAIPLLSIEQVNLETTGIINFGKAPSPSKPSSDGVFVNYWISRSEFPIPPLPGYGYHPNLAQLESIAATCQLCRLIWNEACRLISLWNANLPSIVKNVPLPHNSALKIVKRMDNGSGFAVVAEAPDYPAYVAVANLCAVAEPSKHNGKNALRTSIADLVSGISVASPELAWPVGLRSICLESLSWIRSCLTACEQGHARCAVSEKSIPKRILRLDPAGVVTLVEDEEHTERYAALSYCWGRTQSLTVTTKNHKDFRQGFPTTMLPQTVRDAVELTLALNLRYLWVDALCIMQDSRDDWVVHSASMAQIYGNAYITLAAQDSHAVDEGCVYDLPQGYNVTVDFPLGGASEVAKLFIIEAKDFDPSAFNNSSLASRGWCYQERGLSPKILYLSKTELKYECGERFLGQHGHISESLAKQKAIRPSTHRDGEAILSWADVVVNYSGRSLTKATDRLPALSGMAKHYQRSTTSKYVAGMWSDSILEHLLWIRPGGRTYGTDESIYTTYIAPSWSWAAYWGAMAISDVKDLAPDGFIVKVADCHAVLTSDNDYGEIASGHLTLRGPLITLPSRPRKTSGLLTGSIEKYQFDAIDDETCTLSTLPAQMIMQNYAMTHPNTSMDEMNLFALVLQWTDGKCIWNSVEKELTRNKEIVSALVVTPAEPGKPEMQRVGQVDLYGEDLHTCKRLIDESTFATVVIV